MPRLDRRQTRQIDSDRMQSGNPDRADNVLHVRDARSRLSANQTDADVVRAALDRGERVGGREAQIVVATKFQFQIRFRAQQPEQRMRSGRMPSTPAASLKRNRTAPAASATAITARIRSKSVRLVSSPHKATVRPRSRAWRMTRVNRSRLEARPA